MNNRKRRFRHLLRARPAYAMTNVGGWYLVYVTCPACHESNHGEYADDHVLKPDWTCKSCKKSYHVSWEATLDEMAMAEKESITQTKEAVDGLMSNLATNPISVSLDDASHGADHLKEKIQKDIADRMPQKN